MIQSKLEEIFKEIFADDSLQLTMETSPDDIPEWDSLCQVLIVEQVEKTFDIKIRMDDVYKIRTFGDFVRAVESAAN